MSDVRGHRQWVIPSRGSSASTPSARRSASVQGALFEVGS
jgi:hypothetical protein